MRTLIQRRCGALTESSARRNRRAPSEARHAAARRAAAAGAVRAPALVPGQMPVLRFQFARGRRNGIARGALSAGPARRPRSRAAAGVGPADRQRVHRRRHAEPVSRPTASTHCCRACAACCRWSRPAKSRSRPTLAPSSASAFAPSRRPASTGCRSACRVSTTRCSTRIGRVHDGSQARAAAQEARESFERFNLDLMYALPGQTLQQLQRDLDAALAFEPPHLSVYHLTIEPNTRFALEPAARCPTTTWPATCSMRSSIAHRERRPGALRGVGLRAARPRMRAQPELLAVRRLPRHRRGRAQQAELPASGGAPAALARTGRLHEAGAGRRRP